MISKCHPERCRSSTALWGLGLKPKPDDVAKCSHMFMPLLFNKLSVIGYRYIGYWFFYCTFLGITSTNNK